MELWRELVGILPRKALRSAWGSAVLAGHTDQATSLAVTLEGRVFSGAMDGTVRTWSASSPADVQTLRGHDKAVAALAAQPDGRRLVSGGWDHVACVWDLAKGEARTRFRDHADYVTCAAVVPGSGLVLTGSLGAGIQQ